MTGDADQAVHDQYAAYPYPARDPKDEAKRLIVGSPSHLKEVNHHLFAGARDFARPFRALVAGGGTGDAAIMLAQQLADAGPGQVVYIDLSAASAAIARARAQARGLANISFHQVPIEDLPGSGLGPFDYIDCCGVLHHLADPAAGLRALAAGLAPDGGLGVMVYGEYGRAGLYPLQKALRRLTAGDSLADQVAAAKRLLKALPPTNGFRRNPFLGDHLDGGDAGLVDLLLHPRDRAYTVPQVFDLAAAADLAVTAFIEPVRYDPAPLIADARLRARAAALPFAERAALAEALAGNHRKHVFYLTRPDRAATATAGPGPDMIPLPHELDPAALAKSLTPGQALTVTLDGLPHRLETPRLAAAVLARVDGRTPMGAIAEALQGLRPDLSADGALDQVTATCRLFTDLGKLFLSRFPA
ncbi:MAG: class I SAM-dependent methyltransferase [Rhodobacterales bacterium]|nr:class I SAM-dependent methyltransferase [Rhodobacterales bacterium]